MCFSNEDVLLHALKITVKFRKLTFLYHYHLILGLTHLSPIVPILSFMANNFALNHFFLFRWLVVSLLSDRKPLYINGEIEEGRASPVA